jgi:hypothetical protein
MVPLSFYFWQREKENLHFMHPGQILLHKMMYFELLYMAVGFIVMLLGETITAGMSSRHAFGCFYSATT